MTKRQLISFCIATIVIGVIGIGVSMLPGDQGTPAVANDNIQVMPVNVSTAQLVESYDQNQVYTGIIRAHRTSQLAFEAGGILVQLNVVEGDFVDQGHVLAKVDSETLKARRNATLAQLNQATAQLAELKAGPRVERIQAARASVAAAKSVYQNAALNMQRRSQLSDSGAISREEYDQAVFTERTSAENLNEAEQRLVELERGTRIEQLDAAVARVTQLDAALKEIDVAIAKSTLLAPYSGTVTKRHINIGAVAAPGTPVLKLVESQRLEAWVGLPVEMATTVQVGTPVTVRVNAHSVEAICSAKIKELDPGTRTQSVVFEIDESNPNLMAGQICKIAVARNIRQQGIWVPTSALTSGVRGLWSVMVAEEVAATKEYIAGKRDVEVVYTEIDRALVQGTLQDGDVLIVDGVHRIVEGQPVSFSLSSTPSIENSFLPTGEPASK